MGYCICQEDCSFYIPDDKIDGMLEALKDEMINGCCAGLNDTEILAAIAKKDVRAIFDEAAFEACMDKGNVTHVYYQGDKAWEGMEHFLNVIAPFVDEGSFIEFSGEGGGLYRYVFKGGKCEEKWPTISWD
jgi:hypothetical protein